MMQQRSILILSGIGVIVLLFVFTTLWQKDELSDANSQKAVPAVQEDRDPEAEPEDTALTDAAGSGEDADIEQLMSEIEATANGDEGVLEGEYAAENKSFMEGAVVMEQLGTSYDETSY